jgi:hypothetical protein
MAWGGRTNNISKIPTFPLFSLSLSLSFPLSIPLSFSDVGKEVRRGRQIVQGDAGVCEDDS